MNTADTIIAPATAVGEGGIAVVRISGPQALQALQQFFLPTTAQCTFQSHRLYHGVLVDQQQQHLDEILAVFMAAPHTYTRDDVVEIHCHGSQQVVKAILALYLDFGLRLAQPGEFTYRAFVNGRLDLSQAEAVAQLIHAKSDSSRKLALAQVEGQLSRRLYEYTEQLRQLLTYCEAWIDFPEEDLPAEDSLRFRTTLESIIAGIETITDSYNTGRVLAEGASIMLVGRPNAGKSSLLNTLLGEERAIVTDIPGTTRDLLEEGVTISGVPVRLVDTAGLRQTADPVEREGVRRAKQKIEHADLVLLLVDGSQPIDDQDLYAYEVCRQAPAYLVRTKADLTQRADTSFSSLPEYAISVKSAYGVDALKQGIADFLLGSYSSGSESVLLTEQRHYDALLACSRSLQAAFTALQNEMSLEFVSIDIRESLQYLGLISGQTTTDSILANIFSKFCIGK